MPFDPVPDGEAFKRIHFFVCFLFRKLLWSQVGRRNEKNKALRLVYQIASLVPESTVKKLYEGFIKINHRHRTRLVRILTFPTPKGCYGYKREWYTKLARYRFGDRMLPGARDYEGYLSVKYGDYRSLPPVEKRKVHPISKLILPEK